MSAHPTPSLVEGWACLDKTNINQNKINKEMEKKVYIAPEMEVEVLETEVLMEAASVLGIIQGDDLDTSKEGNLSTGRRGTWGNFWN